MLLLEKPRKRRPFHDHAQPAAGAEHRRLRLDIQRAQIALQSLFGLRLRAGSVTELPAEPVQHARHVVILLPGGAAVLRRRASQLAAIGRGPQLAVDGGHKGRDGGAFFPEMRGDVLSGKAAVSPHGAGRVVHGGKGVHILLIPAAVFLLAGDAHRVGRPVKDPCDVFVVLLARQVFADGFVYVLIDVAQLPETGCHIAPQAELAVSCLHGLQQQARAAEQICRQQ